MMEVWVSTATELFANTTGGLYAAINLSAKDAGPHTARAAHGLDVPGAAVPDVDLSPGFEGECWVFGRCRCWPNAGGVLDLR
jgi:hypothetical protein